MKQFSVVVGLLVVASAGVVSARPPVERPGADAVEVEAQPHMWVALDMLNAAKGQLEKATPDKGGHRVKAIALTKDAIAETKKGIAYDNKKSAEADADELEVQPRMIAARELLEGAIIQLQKATHDKGGHRVKAIAHAKEALTEVKKGIEYDDKN